MLPTRRDFLQGTALGLGALLLPVNAGAALPPAYAAVAKRPDGSFCVTVLDEACQVIFEEDLSVRGHDVAASPDGRLAVVFARRPGRIALVLDLMAGKSFTSFAPPPDRHFYGHGVFSPDGRTLYATENAFDEEKGVIGIYDVGAGFARIGEYESYGVGPHEILLSPDGNTLVIANGGILTHPDFDRQKLNLASMEPSLVYVDRRDGSLLERHDLPEELHQLSLRHMSFAATGEVWFGCQYEGPQTDEVPLVGRHAAGCAPIFIGAAETADMQHYIGSVAACAGGAAIATSSPRGGRVLMWDAASGALLSSRSQSDVCGLVEARGGKILASDGGGNLFEGDRRMAHLPRQWDNHLTRL